MPNVTLQDVADHAGVSIKTVSRVVNLDENVRQSTREKVQRVIEELNFKPNRFARSLAGNKSYLLALLYDNPSAAYILSCQEGVLRECDARGYGLMIHPCQFQSETLVQDVLAMVSQSRPDGLILSPPLSDSAELLNALEKANIHYTRIAPLAHDANDSVVSKEQSAVELLVQKFIEFGHKNIGFLSGDPNHGASQWRLQGYQSALSKAGIEVDQQLIVKGDFSFESGYQATVSLLKAKVQPTAIFASNDYMAAGAMKAIYERGLRIPRDISLAGFDDAPVASQLWPSLSTIRQPVKRLARRATQILIAKINDKKAHTETDELLCELVIRDTIDKAPTLDKS